MYMKVHVNTRPAAREHILVHRAWRHVIGQSGHVIGQSGHVIGQSGHVIGQSGHVIGQSGHVIGHGHCLA